MNAQVKTAKPRIAKFARYINTAIAAVLIIIGIYHYTQPNAAWRSGTAESIIALSLLTGAYLVSPVKAAAINIAVAVFMVGLGIRHAAIGGGWVSGTIEITFAVILFITAVTILRDRCKTVEMT